MNLQDLADELGDAADTVPGLRVHRRTGPAISPPALVVGMPTAVTFDQTYGRGADVVELTLFVMVGRTSDPAGADQLLAYLAGAGDRSIKAAVQDAEYTAADSVHVVSAAVGAITHNGVEYLGATFDLRIFGRGDT